MRLLRTLHAWAGLALALLAVAIACSGTLLVFKADYLRAVFPAARAAVSADPASLGRVVARVEAEFGADARSVAFGTAGMALHQVRLRDGGGAYLDADGDVVAQWSAGGRPELWLFDLHENLLAGETGHVVAGAVGLACALLALTGLVLWWPGARGFRGQVWPRSMRRPALIQQHRDLGVLAALPVLLLALTGAAMVFDGPARAVLAFLLPGAATGPVAPATGPVAAGDSRPDWPALLARAQQRFPRATLRIVSLPDEHGTTAVRLRLPAEWHPNGRTRVALSVATGRILDAYDATRQPPAARAYAALYPLHSAHVGGRGYDVAVALTGLALAGLGLIGGYAFLRQQWRRRTTRSITPATAQERRT